MQKLHTMQQYNPPPPEQNYYLPHDNFYHENPVKIEQKVENINQHSYSSNSQLSHQHFYHAEPSENSSNSNSYYDLVTGNFKKESNDNHSNEVQGLTYEEMVTLKGSSNVQPLQSLHETTKRPRMQTQEQHYGQNYVQNQNYAQNYQNQQNYGYQNHQTPNHAQNYQNHHNMNQNQQFYHQNQFYKPSQSNQQVYQTQNPPNHQNNQAPPVFQSQIFTNNFEESETSSSLNSPNPNSPQVDFSNRPDQDEMGRFNCKKCEKSFKTQTTLYQHMRVKHAANRRRQVNCDLCKLTFPIKEKLLKHYDSAMHVLAEDNPEYLASFHQHIDCTNQDKEWDTRPYKCRTCNNEHTKYAQPHDAFKHVAKYHFTGNVVQKNHHYKCNECSMVWKSKSRLEVHILQEHAVPQLECDICSKKFGWICDLQTHREWRHREALQKSDNIENNDEEYKNIGGIGKSSNNDISLNCTVIEDDASLKLNSNVMKQSNGTMPCRICRISLTDEELRDHYQIHHVDACRRDDGFFHCDTCNEKFDNRVQMLNHREGKHNIGGRYYRI